MLDGSDVDDAVCIDIAVGERRASVRTTFLSQSPPLLVSNFDF